MVLNGVDVAIVIAVILIIELMFFVLYRAHKVERECAKETEKREKAWGEVFQLLELRTQEQNKLIKNMKNEMGIEGTAVLKKQIAAENEAFDKQMGYNLDTAYGSTPMDLSIKEE